MRNVIDLDYRQGTFDYVILRCLDACTSHSSCILTEDRLNSENWIGVQWWKLVKFYFLSNALSYYSVSPEVPIMKSLHLSTHLRSDIPLISRIESKFSFSNDEFDLPASQWRLWKHTYMHTYIRKAKKRSIKTEWHRYIYTLYTYLYTKLSNIIKDFIKQTLIPHISHNSYCLRYRRWWTVDGHFVFGYVPMAFHLYLTWFISSYLL